jgi:hypothetical protein
MKVRIILMECTKIKIAMSRLIVDGGIFGSLSTETLESIGLTPYQLGILFYKRSGDKYANSLVEAFMEAGQLTVQGYKILGQLFEDKYGENIRRIMLALSAEYNPIENYDRTESTSDTGNESTTSTSKGSNSGGGTISNNVSAFDSTGYQPESQTVSSDSATNSQTGSSTRANTVKHEARIHGNIGVTTNQQMINEEIRMRNSAQISEMICKWADDEFCLKVYG